MKKLLFSVMALIFLSSCDSDEPAYYVENQTNNSDSNSVNVDPEPNPLYVNGFELNRLLQSQISPVKPISRSVTTTVDTVFGADNTPVIYIVNYGENEGFVVTSALKTAYPILAYNTKGHYSLHELNPSADFILGNMKKNVENTLHLPEDSIKLNKALWQSMENPKDILSRTEDLPDDYDTWSEDLKEKYQKSIYTIRGIVDTWERGEYVFLDGSTNYSWLTGISRDQIYDPAEGNCYPPFMSRYQQLSVARHVTTVLVDDEFPGVIESTWHQDYPYNFSYPYDNGIRTPVGCGPLAAGQIMRYYQWPTTFNWDQMPLKKEDVGNYGMVISNMLLQIAEAAKATYKAQLTTVTPSNLSKAVENFGYKSEGVKDLKSAGQISFCHVRPVIICGNTSSGTVGHAFIASGYSKFGYQESVQVYTIRRPEVFECVSSIALGSIGAENIYLNWGYGGDSDGFFNYSYMRYGNNLYNKDLKYIEFNPK